MDQSLLKKATVANASGSERYVFLPWLILLLLLPSNAYSSIFLLYFLKYHKITAIILP